MLISLSPWGVFMLVQEAIAQRRSVREFQNKEIPRVDLIKIVDAGRLAPTAKNIQPWEFIVVIEQGRKEEIARITEPNGAFIAGCAASIIVVCEDTKYYLEDGSAACENILIQAAALKIGSCWVAGDKKPYAQDVLALFGVSDKYKLVAIIALGYPKNPKADKAINKRKLQEVLHWEKF